MADLKISQLPVFTSAVPATDAFAVVSGGTTKQITTNQILGSSGVATLASATITGDLTVDTSTLKVDSTNNRVGIGTATPTVTLDVVGAGRFVAAATGPKLSIENAGGSTRFLSTDTSSFYYSAYDHNFTNTAGTVDRLVIANSGNVTVSNGNVVMGTANKGIDFSINSDASATSELLNDYEEGTWTPALATDTVNFTSVGYSTQAAKYTKVGNLVTFAGTIQTSSVVKGLASGAVVITGLPFAQPAVDARGGVNCFAASAWAVDFPLSGEIITSTIYLLKRATSVSATATLTVADVATGASSNLVRFSGQYYV